MLYWYLILGILSIAWLAVGLGNLMIEVTKLEKEHREKRDQFEDTQRKYVSTLEKYRKQNEQIIKHTIDILFTVIH